MAENGEYELCNAAGARVRMSAMGAALRMAEAPDRTGAFANVALPAAGPLDPSYAGAVLAPWAGRIPGGRMEIDGRVCRLARNEGKNQLHGGPNSLARRAWRFLGYAEGPGWREARFEAEAIDGLDGFPGNRRFETAYRLWDENRLDVRFCAETDRPTRVNLSSHAYWNLSGDFSQSVDGHLLEVQADAVYVNDKQHLAAGLEATDRPPFDFRSPRPLGGMGEPPNPQLAFANGYNHAFVLRRRGSGEPAAVLTDPRSGRRLRLYTDQPCLVVYGGGYLSPPRRAVALEAQEHPLAPGAPAPPPLLPGSPYRRVISWRFDTVT